MMTTLSLMPSNHLTKMATLIANSKYSIVRVSIQENIRMHLNENDGKINPTRRSKPERFCHEVKIVN